MSIFIQGVYLGFLFSLFSSFLTSLIWKKQDSRIHYSLKWKGRLLLEFKKQEGSKGKVFQQHLPVEKKETEKKSKTKTNPRNNGESPGISLIESEESIGNVFKYQLFLNTRNNQIQYF
jgi:hypothetical protein